MRLARTLLSTFGVMVLGLGRAGCGGGSDTKSGAQLPPVIIEIRESGGQITPDDGHVVTVAVGQEVKLNVSSDVADEIHVHSVPEHEFEVPAGANKTFTFTLDTPGTVIVESHGLDVVLVKLQAS